MNPNDEFGRMVEKEFPEEFRQETIDPTPYGAPTHPVKPGLTKRGKAAVALGGAIIATGALVGYQAYSSSAADSNAKAQEIALQQQRIELDKLKEINRASNNKKSQGNILQASIDKCVKDNKNLIGHGFNSSYRDIVDACQAQYSTSNTSDDMQNTASTEDTNDNHGGGSSEGVFLGIGVLVAGVVVVSKLGSRRNQA